MTSNLTQLADDNFPVCVESNDSEKGVVSDVIIEDTPHRAVNQSLSISQPMPLSTHDLLDVRAIFPPSQSQYENGDPGHVPPGTEVKGQGHSNPDQPTTNGVHSGKPRTSTAGKSPASQNARIHSPSATNGTSPKRHVTKAQSFTATSTTATKSSKKTEAHKVKDELKTLTLAGPKRGLSKSLDMGQARHRTLSISSSHSGGTDNSATSPKSSGPIRARIGSLDNAHHTPAGGHVKIFNEKLDYNHVTSRCGSLDNVRHKPKGGDKKIETQKLEWKARPRIGSLDNASHRPGGGEKKIESQKLTWNAQSKIGSFDNTAYHGGGGGRKIEMVGVDFRELSQTRTDSGVHGI